MRVTCRRRAEERLNELALFKDTLGDVGSKNCLWNDILAGFRRVFVAEVRERLTPLQHELEFAASG